MEKGFKVKVNNYGPGKRLTNKYRYHASTPMPGAKATFAKGWVYVTALKPGASARVRLSVSKSSCTTVTADTLGAAIAPAQSFSIEEVRKTQDGFVFIVYGPSESTFTVHIDKGTLSGQQEDGTFIVSEMAAGQLNKVTVTLREPGHRTGVKSKTIRSGQLVPTYSFSFMSRDANALIYRINGYDPETSYSVQLGQPSDPNFDVSRVTISVGEGSLIFGGVPLDVVIPFTVTATKAPYFDRVVTGTIR
jgi:hypothetical protein